MPAVVEAENNQIPDFHRQIQPLFTKLGCNSGACHGALAGKGGLKLSLRGYDDEADHFVLTRQAGGRRVESADPDASLLLRKPLGQLPHGGGRKLETGDADHALLRAWIAAGAPSMATRPAQVQRLEAFPPAVLLQPQDTFRVVVRAIYTDGTAADVTRWAKFGSSEEQVARVTEDGQVVIVHPGAAAVTVWFANHVATVDVAVPFANSTPVFPADPKALVPGVQHNFIDVQVNQRLAELRLPAAPPCTDREFVRRAFLDTCGILPTPVEVEQFVADPAADKRHRLIDHLLERPEFVDYWTYKWSDLLLVSSRKLAQPAVWSFHQFVRQAVAENRPWDQFAATVLTARGSTLQNGAANYYVMHQDVSDLTETTAVTFLGMSITCARCHNHPLEKWTQDQYWGLASLFSRVGIKNGDRPGEFQVWPLPFGEALHLRRGVPQPPAPLDAPAIALEDPGDRRAVFARWLTAPDNPYFAKAIVNRVWRNFMGRGLIEAEDDLRQTNPPTNPALLAALEAHFRAQGHDLKKLMALILQSATYQRSSVPPAGTEADDRFYSRYLIRRLKAEVILDAYSQVLGVPTPFEQIHADGGGMRAVPDYPAGTRALELPDTKVVSRFLTAFGRPERELACACERDLDASVGQALHLNNGATLNNKLRADAGRLAQWLQEKLDDATLVERVYAHALGRPPTAEEKRRCVAELAQATAPADRRAALEDLFWAVLTSREFLFNH